MKRALFFVLLLSAASNTIADNWKLIMKDSFTKFYINTSNIQRKGDNVIYWQRMDMSSSSSNARWHSIVSYSKYESDCYNQRVRKLTNLVYVDNDSAKKVPVDSSWIDIVPDTGREEILNMVCKK